MPLPTDMKKCMSKVKKEYPTGRSNDKNLSKKDIHKQHVAMCLNAQESVSYTFIDFLVESEPSKTIANQVASEAKKMKV